MTQGTNSLYGNTIFTHNLHWTELWFSDFCCNSESPDGRYVQDGLTDRMMYQRHEDGFFVFLVCLVHSERSSLLSNTFCGLLHTHVGLILIFQADLVSGYTCAPQCILLTVCLFCRCNICHNHVGYCTHTVC
jgi:hypothetical protein